MSPQKVKKTISEKEREAMDPFQRVVNRDFVKFAEPKKPKTPVIDPKEVIKAPNGTKYRKSDNLHLQWKYELNQPRPLRLNFAATTGKVYGILFCNQENQNWGDPQWIGMINSWKYSNEYNRFYRNQEASGDKDGSGVAEKNGDDAQKGGTGKSAEVEGHAAT